MLLVEPGRSLVADRARKPCGLETVRKQPRLRIRDQSGSDAGATRLGSDIELPELIAFEHVEPERHPHWPDNPRMAERRFQTLSEIFAHARSDQRLRQDRSMRILPAVVPKAGEDTRIVKLGGPDNHRTSLRSFSGASIR